MAQIMLFVLGFVQMVSVNNFIVEQRIEESNEIIEKLDDYTIQGFDDEQIVFHQGRELLRVSTDINLKMVKHYNRLVVAYVQDRFLEIIVFDSFDRIYAQTTSVDWVVDEFDIINIEDQIYVVGGISSYRSDLSKSLKKDGFSGIDAFIACLDIDYQIAEMRIYGGGLDEYFHRIEVYQNHIYVIGYKDTLSGGDFGNSGKNYASIICLFSGLDLITYQSLQDQDVLEINFNDFVYLLTVSEIYQLDVDLNHVLSLEFGSSCVFGVFSFNSLVLVLFDSEGIIYDLKLMKQIHRFDVDGGFRVYVIDDDIVLRYHHQQLVLNIFDLRNFSWEYIYQGELRNDIIRSFFKELELDNYVINPHFNPLVYGSYQVFYDYQEIVVEGEVIVEVEANVSNQQIYPLGYRLMFTGIAYLNNQLIVNNHSILTPGPQSLVLYGANGQEHEICFYVDQSQTFVSEYSNKHWDLEVGRNQSFEIGIEFDNPNDYQILGIVVNDDFTEDFRVEDGVLYVRFSESISGVYTFNLQELWFDNNYHIYLDELFRVCVLKDGLMIEGVFSDNQKQILYTVGLVNNEAIARGLRLRAISAGEELVFDYPLGNKNLVVSGLRPKQDYDISVILISNHGGVYFQETELFVIRVDSSDGVVRVGEVNVLQSGLNLEKFQIQISKDNHILVDNQFLYLAEDNSVIPYIILGLVIGVVISGGIYVYKRAR